MTTEFHGLLDEHAEDLRKPLYLQGRNGLAVMLDGPALRIEQPERAAVLYPLARLARVLSKGGVRWRCEALLACAGAGIPVVFLDGAGGVQAYLFGSSGGENTLYLRLRSCRRHPTGMALYMQWRRTMAAHARRTLARQLRLTGHTVGQWVWRADASVGLLTSIKALDDNVCQQLGGLLAGFSAQLWAEAGLGAQRLVSLEPLQVVDDLAGLLGWALIAPILRASSCGDWGESQPDGCDEHTLTGLVEARRDEIFRFGRLLLACLENGLREC
jgi:hypothetical protein